MNTEEQLSAIEQQYSELHQRLEGSLGREYAMAAYDLLQLMANEMKTTVAPGADFALTYGEWTNQMQEKYFNNQANRNSVAAGNDLIIRSNTKLGNGSLHQPGHPADSGFSHGFANQVANFVSHRGGQFVSANAEASSATSPEPVSQFQVQTVIRGSR